MKNPNDPIGNRNLDLPACSSVLFYVVQNIHSCLWNNVDGWHRTIPSNGLPMNHRFNVLEEHRDIFGLLELEIPRDSLT